MIKIIFAMYNPDTDCVEVYLDNQIHISFDYQKCIAAVRLNESMDISYLTRLAREELGYMPSLPPKMVECKGMLMHAMGEFN